MRLAVILALSFTAAPAFGQVASLDKVYACAAITDGGARLACFDEAVSGLKQAQTSGGVAVVSREQIQAAEREAFGLEAPRLSELARSTAPVAPGAAPGAPAASVELDKVTLNIKSMEKRADGAYRFTMDNGQVWQQIDTYSLGALPKTIATAEIRRASVGSYMLKPGDRSAVRVRRVQ